MSATSNYNTVSELIAPVPVELFRIKRGQTMDAWQAIKELLDAEVDPAPGVVIELTLETAASRTTFRRKIKITSIAFRDGYLEFTAVFAGCNVVGNWSGRSGEFALC